MICLDCVVNMETDPVPQDSHDPLSTNGHRQVVQTLWICPECGWEEYGDE